MSFLRKGGSMTSFLLVWSAIDKRAAVRTASPAIEACVKRWHAHLYTFLYYIIIRGHNNTNKNIQTWCQLVLLSEHLSRCIIHICTLGEFVNGQRNQKNKQYRDNDNWKWNNRCIICAAYVWYLHTARCWVVEHERVGTRRRFIATAPTYSLW